MDTERDGVPPCWGAADFCCLMLGLLAMTPERREEEVCAMALAGRVAPGEIKTVLRTVEQLLAAQTIIVSGAPKRARPPGGILPEERWEPEGAWRIGDGMRLLAALGRGEGQAAHLLGERRGGVGGLHGRA